MYIVFVVSFVVELLLILFNPKNQTAKSILAGLTILLVGFSSSSFLIVQPSLSTILLCAVSIIRLVNPLRYAENRMHPDELRRRALRTFLTLGALSLMLFLTVILRYLFMSILFYKYRLL